MEDTRLLEELNNDNGFSMSTSVLNGTFKTVQSSLLMNGLTLWTRRKKRLAAYSDLRSRGA